MAEEFSYEITEKHGVLSTSKSGWTMELNSVSWNGRSPKFDIRSWSPDHEKMGKGITLSAEEAAALKTVLNAMQL
ncbi:MAG: YdbC family protein [Treponema sp.]